MTAALIGRDHPAGLLRAEIGRAAESHGGLVLVTGKAGIGKTTLVTGAAEEAKRLGVLVLSGSCWDSGSAPGYWPWVQVIRGLRRSAAPEEWETAEDAGGSTLSVLLGESPNTEAGDGFQLYDTVTTALVSVSQSRPVVVVLDDLHWADAASLKLLEFAARHTWFERPLLVGTYRDAEVEPEEASAAAADDAAGGEGHDGDPDGPGSRRCRHTDGPHGRPRAGCGPGRRGAPPHRRQPVLRGAGGSALAQRQFGYDHSHARAKGLRDLHFLLSGPGTDIPAVRLLSPEDGDVVIAARRMDGDLVLDDEAKTGYQRRLGQLDEEIDRAAERGDDRRAAGFDRERQALSDELRAAAGLTGRGHRLGDEAERARKTVTARIRDTLRKLDERHPELAAHLRSAVSTGSTCCYHPGRELPWRL
jgi:hypothetical protein